MTAAYESRPELTLTSLVLQAFSTLLLIVFYTAGYLCMAIVITMVNSLRHNVWVDLVLPDLHSSIVPADVAQSVALWRSGIGIGVVAVTVLGIAALMAEVGHNAVTQCICKAVHGVAQWRLMYIPFFLGCVWGALVSLAYIAYPTLSNSSPVTVQPLSISAVVMQPPPFNYPYQVIALTL